MIDWGYVFKRLNVSLSHLREFLPDVMPVHVVLWRVGIGIFNFPFFAKLSKTKFQLNSNGTEVSYFFIFCVLRVLITCGEIELNPGPKKDKSCDNFSLCHWNLNSVAAHDLSKLSLLEAYNTHHMYDIICLSKTYLDSSVSDDDPRLNLSGYKLVRTDNLSNNKRCGVGIYFKETLAIRPVPTNSLKECLLLEIFIGNKKGFVLSLYRLPSQS